MNPILLPFIGSFKQISYLHLIALYYSFLSLTSGLLNFEVYDERSVDHNNVTLDIYIGIRK
ncbi:hypothetical protein MIDIC_50065 [Alphaproteobacteria bacterium]